MTFRLVPIRPELTELLESEMAKLDYDKGVELHQPMGLPKRRFGSLRFFFVTLIITVFGLPILLYSFLQRLMTTKKSVNGQVILVTGAARGLGRQLALQLSRLGAKVACVDLNLEGAAETAKIIKKEGGKAAAFKINVAKTVQIAQLRLDVEKELGPVDILINNAALLMALKFKEWEENEIRTFYEVNILSHYFMIKEFLPGMIHRKKGHIVAMSSVAALFPAPFLSLYGPTKAATTSLLDNLRVEMEMLGHPIKFTAIHPYFVRTSLEVEEFADIGLPTLDEEDAVKSMVNAILLEETSVTVPRYLWAFLGFAKLLPTIFNTITTYILDPTICLPEEQIREMLPYKRILEDSMKKDN